MARWTIYIDVESDSEDQVAAYADYCANLPTDHEVTVHDAAIRCEG